LPDPVAVVPYDPEWPALFAELAAQIRMALGPLALRIDHVGSTAIPGLAAKPVIDVQVSVETFDDSDEIARAMDAIGFAWRRSNPDRTKRYFREKPGGRRTHIHVRRAGSFQEAFTLLFRDYLRCHPEDARAYEEKKYELAKAFEHDRPAYVDGKAPIIWEIIMRANQWSQETGWHPGPSDA
jgi:GrpB-like predicted nucleotidyltransferase (UPF0157 family)